MARKQTGENPYETIVLDTEPEPAPAPAVSEASPEPPAQPRVRIGPLLAGGLLVLALGATLFVWGRSSRSPQALAELPALPAADSVAAPLPTSAPPAAPTSAPAPSPAPAPTSAPTAAPTSAPELPADALLLGTVGGEWLFDQPALKARAGQAVTLVFSNGSKTQPHNWVLVRAGADAAAVVAAGASAGEAAGYLAGGADVLASTRLLKGGEREVLRFTAPAAGTYAFICTVPGHFETGMAGELTVTE